MNAFTANTKQDAVIGMQLQIEDNTVRKVIFDKKNMWFV